MDFLLFSLYLPLSNPPFDLIKSVNSKSDKNTVQNQFNSLVYNV